MIAPKFERLRKAVGATPTYTIYGKVAQVVGLVIESNGPHGRIGDLCTIATDGGTKKGERSNGKEKADSVADSSLLVSSFPFLCSPVRSDRAKISDPAVGAVGLD